MTETTRSVSLGLKPAEFQEIALGCLDEHNRYPYERDSDVKPNWDEIADRYKLIGREREIFTRWGEEGTLGNTFFMMFYTRHFVHYEADIVGNSDINPPKRLSDCDIATTFFTDISNRADTFFDERRSLFISGNGKIEFDPLSCPILKLDNDDCATVKDCSEVFWKIISESPEFSEKEFDFLKDLFQWFYETTTNTMRTREALPGRAYTMEEALSLRKGTVGSIGIMIANIMSLSRLHLGNPAQQERAEILEQAVENGALITQIGDDFFDVEDDIEHGNTNLVIGAMNQTGETFDPSKRWTFRNFRKNYPLSFNLIQGLYYKLRASLPSGYENFLLYVHRDRVRYNLRRALWILEIQGERFEVDPANEDPHVIEHQWFKI